MPGSRRFRLLCVALLAGACSGLLPSDAIHDLSAIHDPADGSPRSPAPLRIAPADYLEGARQATPLRIGDPVFYEVPDHGAVELAILDVVWRTEPLDFGLSLEAAAWLIVLMEHDHPAATRIRAASVLASLAAGWIHQAGARLPAPAPAGDLASAVDGVLAAWDPALADWPARAPAALAALDQAALDDALAAARLVAGLAGRYRAAPLPGAASALARLGLRSVELALRRGAADPDAELAVACRVLHEQLLVVARAE